ncbi:MAG: NrfD/PsrC family molybdoenzyme membrane anchor subunit [Rhodospirillales bacterium]
MIGELYWGWGIVVHLFLVGLSAGTLIISACLLLRGGRSDVYFRVARYGAFIAPLPVIFDGFVLISELGSFEVGNWFRWLNLYKTITWSPMSIGTWLITLFIGVSVVYAYTFWSKDAAPDDKWDILRKAMAWIGLPLAIAVGTYPGVMLGVMQSRPFWNSPLLPLVLLLSAMATGIACIVLARILLHRRGAEPEVEREYRRNNFLLTTSNVVVLGGELLLLFLFILFAYLTVGSVRHAISVIMAGGTLATEFWLWVVLIGLLVPIGLGLFSIVPRLAEGKEYVVSRGLEVAVPLTVLVGAFMLRYVVVVAGQITGPVGV